MVQFGGEWVILDDGSTDITVARWHTWASTHPMLVLRVQHSAKRLGKAVKLEEVRRLPSARRDPEWLMVACDSDTKVDAAVFLHLLDLSLDNPQLVVWGVALPLGPTNERGASLIQSRFAATAVRQFGLESIQANGATRRVQALKATAETSLRSAVDSD